jgi:hypothetical protein
MGSGVGVYGLSASMNGAGVHGEAVGMFDGIGVLGTSNGVNGQGVVGLATQEDGTAVYGEASGDQGVGLRGISSSPDDLGYGVFGSTNSTHMGAGVFGKADSPAGFLTYGVRGESHSQTGHGVSGLSTGFQGRGVYGLAQGQDGVGVYGQASGTSAGIGVLGTSDADGGQGVVGLTTGNDDGLTEDGAAVYGKASGNGGVGLRGISSSPNSSLPGYGVFGSTSSGNMGAGVFGESFNTQDASASYGLFGRTQNPAGAGVYGENLVGGIGVLGTSDADDGRGIVGRALGDDGTGVYGEAFGDRGVGLSGLSTTFQGKGVYGLATGHMGVGVYGKANNSTDKAGYFEGNVHVNGTLSKNAGSFRIDHPLDPANKYLFHSFVESPDMLNVYNGNVVLDDRGRGRVELQEWFQALNVDYRYQLTCIGAHAPIYIARKIEDNAFAIAGGTPGLEVSWQVTGIRNDTYARDHRIPVELDKPESERVALSTPPPHN